MKIRTFAEFVFESTGRDIYDSRYDNASGSKANRLRMFWQKEDNRVVGKLMKDLLDLLGEASPTAEACRLIVGRLLDGSSALNVRATPDRHEAPGQQLSAALSQLKDEFGHLAAEKDRNKAGLEFEKFLNRLFDLFQLKPRQPFCVVGEQIDGSFDLDGHIYLLELKWENRALPEADLLIFRGKIEGKSTFTRGAFTALNGITAEAHHAITRGKSPSFFVMPSHRSSHSTVARTWENCGVRRERTQDGISCTTI